MVGVRVVVWYGGAVGVEVAAATTDGNGYYRIPDVKPSSRFGEIGFVSKPGYFIELKSFTLSQDTQLDFALDPWVPIALDAVTRGQVGDTLCEWSGPCERFAFAPSSSGTLALTAPAFPFDLEVLEPPNGALAAFHAGSSGPLQLRLPVEAGVPYEIRVVHTSVSPTREFMLTASTR